ncbi:hypothetical protein ERJ75_000590900 [Trypanosoma vivax]|nr:hypothetical protein ERJ75_000590900 [Trypanosoma vivax]
MRRVQRFRDFDYQVWTDGSVVLDVSSGAGALVYPKEGRREKVVLGAGSLACSYRAECVAMEAGLKRLVEVIELSKTHRTRVVAFTDSLSLLMALNTGPAAVEDAILRRIWDLILRIVRLACPSTSSSSSRIAVCHETRRQTRQLSRETRSRSPIRRGSQTSSLVWRGRCGTRCTGPLRRVGCHARIAVRFSITSGQHQSTPR